MGDLFGPDFYKSIQDDPRCLVTSQQQAQNILYFHAYQDASSNNTDDNYTCIIFPDKEIMAALYETFHLPSASSKIKAGKTNGGLYYLMIPSVLLEAGIKMLYRLFQDNCEFLTSSIVLNAFFPAAIMNLIAEYHSCEDMQCLDIRELDYLKDDQEQLRSIIEEQKSIQSSMLMSGRKRI